MEESLRVGMAIKSGQKVSLFHAPKKMLSEFMKGDLNLMMDWAENDCDAIIYWLQAGDDVVHIFTNLEKQIKKSGRIWLVIPDEEEGGNMGFKGLTEVHKAILAVTNLVEGKTISLDEHEIATQFMMPKASRES
jgi:hypothetical protein